MATKKEIKHTLVKATLMWIITCIPFRSQEYWKYALLLLLTMTAMFIMDYLFIWGKDDKKA